MNLYTALNPALPAFVAITGAGGKTTALFQLARQVDGIAWATTTTHLGIDQVNLADQHFTIDSSQEIDLDAFKQYKVTLLTSSARQDCRLHGLAPDLLDQLHQSAENEKVSIFIEADGSRRLPLKAPAEHEPVIPAWTTHTIVVVGLSVLGKPLNELNVFRPEQFSHLSGLCAGETITIESISEMLIHPLGGLKNTPPGAHKAVLLNQSDIPEIRDKAISVIPKLLNGGFDRVILGSLGTNPTRLECFAKRDVDSPSTANQPAVI